MPNLTADTFYEDGPLQLIEFTNNTEGNRLQLRQHTIDTVSRNIGDLPICIISVCGPSRQGKSFLLGYIIRRLIGIEEDVEDWMGWTDKTRPLEGFRFRNGKSPETKGIWIWSRPFKMKNDHGKEVAVLLMDTQGTYDESTTIKDMTAIIGLSILMSSVIVFNNFTNLQEDVLCALKAYMEYGRLALNEEEQSGPPFQKLNFLIRDWNNPGEYAYGIEGGQKFLKEKLKVTGRQSDEAKHVRQIISNCFDELSCFLMPSIGDEALCLEFTGSLSELSQRFAQYMEKFINSLVNPESLRVKTLVGSPVSATELKSTLETYINVFNSDEVPSAESMWQATSQICNNNAYYKAIIKYDERMISGLEETHYLSKKALRVTHSEAKSEAMSLFNQARKIGSPELICELKQKLTQSIAAAFSEFHSKNKVQRETFIAAATAKAIQEFKFQLENEFSFLSGTEFYDEAKITMFAENKQSILLDIFRLKLSNEGSNCLDVYVDAVQGSFKTILFSHVNQNNANRSNAVELLEKYVYQLCSDHRSQFHFHLNANKFEQDEAKLQNAHNLVKTGTAGKFKLLKIPGDEGFQTKYLAMLNDKLQECYTQLINEHMFQIQNVKAKAAQCVQNCIAKYKELMQDGVRTSKTQGELLICHENAQSTAINHLKITLPDKHPVIVEEFQISLNEKIKDSFAECQKLFGANRAEAAAKAKAVKKARDGAKARFMTRAAVDRFKQAKAEADEARIREAVARSRALEAERKAMEAQRSYYESSSDGCVIL